MGDGLVELRDLPLELFDTVIAELDLTSLRSFRLVSRLCNHRAARKLWRTLHLDLNNIDNASPQMSNQKLPFTRLDQSWLVRGKDSPFTLQQRLFSPCIVINEKKFDQFVSDLKSGLLDFALSHVWNLTVESTALSCEPQLPQQLELERLLRTDLTNSFRRLRKIDIILTATEEGSGDFLIPLLEANAGAEKHVHLLGELITGCSKLINQPNARTVVIDFWDEVLFECGIDGIGPELSSLPCSIQVFELFSQFWPVLMTRESQNLLKQLVTAKPRLRRLLIPRFDESRPNEYCISDVEWIPASVQCLDWRDPFLPQGKLTTLQELRIEQCNKSLLNLKLGNLQLFRFHSMENTNAFKHILDTNPSLRVVDVCMQEWEYSHWGRILHAIAHNTTSVETLVADGRSNTQQGFLTLTSHFKTFSEQIPHCKRLYLHCRNPLDEPLRRFSRAAKRIFTNLDLFVYQPQVFGPSMYPTTHFFNTTFRL